MGRVVWLRWTVACRAGSEIQPGACALPTIVIFRSPYTCFVFGFLWPQASNKHDLQNMWMHFRDKQGNMVSAGDHCEAWFQSNKLFWWH